MSGKDDIKDSNYEVRFFFRTPCNIPTNSTLKMIVSTSDLQFLNINDQTYCETSFRSLDCWLDATKNLFVRIDEPLPSLTDLTVITFARSKSRATSKPVRGEIYALPDKPSTLVNSIATINVLPPTNTRLLTNCFVFPLLIKPLY